MLEQAIEKLQAEMDKEGAKNPMVQFFGQYVLSQLQEHPEYAERILQEGKTVAKAVKSLERYAMSKRSGSMAYVPDPDGYAIILQHFDCWEGEPFEIPPEPEHKPYVPQMRTTATTVTKPSVTATVKGKGKKEAPDQLSLFDMLDESTANDDEFIPDDEEGACCE